MQAIFEPPSNQYHNYLKSYEFTSKNVLIFILVIIISLNAVIPSPFMGNCFRLRSTFTLKGSDTAPTIPTSAGAIGPQGGGYSRVRHERPTFGSQFLARARVVTGRQGS
jgi:hypothetical protein